MYRKSNVPMTGVRVMCVQATEAQMGGLLIVNLIIFGFHSLPQSPTLDCSVDRCRQPCRSPKLIVLK